MKELKELAEVTRAALDYIDAIPAEIAATFPVMPGLDRDWAENVLADMNLSLLSDVKAGLGIIGDTVGANVRERLELYADVRGEVLEQVIPAPTRFVVDMSGIEPLPEDAERKEAFINAMRARDMAEITNEQLVTHIQRHNAGISRAIKQCESGDNTYNEKLLAVNEVALAALTAPDDIPRPVLDKMSDMCDGGFNGQGIWDLCKAAILKGQYDDK